MPQAAKMLRSLRRLLAVSQTDSFAHMGIATERQNMEEEQIGVRNLEHNKNRIASLKRAYKEDREKRKEERAVALAA